MTQTEGNHIDKGVFGVLQEPGGKTCSHTLHKKEKHVGKKARANVPVTYRVVSMGSSENISTVSRKRGCCEALVFLCYSELLKLFSPFQLEPSSCVGLLIPV